MSYICQICRITSHWTHVCYHKEPCTSSIQVLQMEISSLRMISDFYRNKYNYLFFKKKSFLILYSFKFVMCVFLLQLGNFEVYKSKEKSLSSSKEKEWNYKNIAIYTWIVLAMASTTWGNIEDAWSNGVPTDNCAVKSFWPISIVYNADANVDGKGRTSLNQPRQKTCF